jgi:hypothetical protein
VRLARLMLPGLSQLKLIGKYAYGLFGSQLAIVDLGVPTAPVLVGTVSFAITPSTFQIVGGLAYVTYSNGIIYYQTDPGGGLEIVDITDPAHPARIGGYTANSAAFGVAVAKGYAYITTLKGLQVVDVHTPARPVLRSTYAEQQYSASNIQIENNLLYVIFSGGDAQLPYYHLDILDISDPADLKLRGKSTDIISIAHQLQVVGTQVYIYEGFCRLLCGYGLMAIDASNPTNLKGPTRLQGLPSFWDFQISQSRLYLLAEKLYIFDLAGIEAPTARGNYAVATGLIDAVQVVGQRAFVLGSSGLEIIDISDISSPRSLGSIAAGVNDLEIRDQLAYVAEVSKLNIFDVSDPGSLTLRGTFAVSGTLDALDIDSHFAYLASFGQLSIVDVSDATAPVLRGSYVPADMLRDVQIDGAYAYLATVRGLDILDVSDPNNPSLLSHVALQFPNAVQIVGGRAYIANRQYGVQIVDISNPAAPVLRGAYKVATDVVYVQVADDLLYIADSHAIRVVDVHDPDNPLPRATFMTIGQPWRMQVVGDLVYAADLGGGLLILRVHPKRFPEPMLLTLVAR